MNNDAYPDQVTFTPGPASAFKWVAAGPNPCPRCAELDGQVRTLDSWQSSVMPGLHNHCHCKLVCTEETASGWIFADQYPYTGFTFFNIDGSISHDPSSPGPHHLPGDINHDPEGAEDTYIDPRTQAPKNDPKKPKPAQSF